MINLKDRLVMQKREIEARRGEFYIERDQALSQMNKGVIIVVMGPRRAGKSTFAIHELLKTGPFGYVNFDDENLIDLEDYDELIEKVNVVYGNQKTLFLDEIQNLRNWELLVNRLQRQGFNLVISGSSANILSREMATHLTGRHLSITILPLSFREFLRGFGASELTAAETKAKLDLYMEWGGYPEPLAKKLDYKDYLSTLVDSVIYKDIVKRFRIRNPPAFENLTLYVISNAASAYSYNTLAELTKVRSPNTVEKYLNYLEEAFLIFRINRFSHKVRNQLKSDKKIYCVDNGIISAKGFRILERPSSWYENLVAVRLWKKFANNLFYYKHPQGDYEVDFVVRERNRTTQLIQVCCSLEDPKTRTREFRALVAASKELRCDNLIVLTQEEESEEIFEWFGERRRIVCIPVVKWLLGQ